MLYCITVSSNAKFILNRERSIQAMLNLPDLEIRREYFFETEGAINVELLAMLKHKLADPILENATEFAPPVAQYHVWVAYKRSIVDNESDSLRRLCHILGINAFAAKVAVVYLSDNPDLKNLITERRFNPNIEDIFTERPNYEVLQPSGHYTPIKTFNLIGLGDHDLMKVGRAEGRNLDLSKIKQAQSIQKELGAPSVSDVFLESLDARWSDHCDHTTWKSLGNLLSRLVSASRATANTNIVSMFEDNAGVWDFYDGMALAIKGETHNGPSAISAYFGQLTKLGGVLRDILGVGLGADPVGSFEYTATGIPGCRAPLIGRPAPREVAEDTIRAIKEYGNTFGVPMMSSRMCFHQAFRAKPFALGGCIGLIPKNLASKGQPKPNDLLMLIGGLTGNDGIHGASASSVGATMDQAAVQIGSPLEQVKFNTAILDLRNAGCLRAITDVGGAGLNSAVGEIGDPGGIWVNTALVPLKTEGLPMWRILLSESQERMVLGVKLEMLDQARSILLAHEVRNTVIGKFTGLGRYTVVYDPYFRETDVVEANHSAMPMSGEVGMDVPYDLLRYIPEQNTIDPPNIVNAKLTLPLDLTVDILVDLMPKLLADIEVCDQALADSQYDSTVQGRRTYGPVSGPSKPVRTSYWAGEMLPGKPFAAVFTSAFNPWLFEANPRLAARQCFLEVIGRMVLAGVDRRDVAFCDNFYTPHLSKDWAYWLEAMVDELAELVRQFGTPIISGKDSSAGSVHTDEGLVHVPPSVFLSAIGKSESFDSLLRNDWKHAGNVLVQIGPRFHSAAGSAIARVLGLDVNDVDGVDSESYKSYLEEIKKSDRSQWESGVSIGPGGILGTLAQRAMSSGLGVELVDTENHWDLLLEHRCGAIIEIQEHYFNQLSVQLQPRIIGRLTSLCPSVCLSGVELLSTSAIASWQSAFQRMLE